VIKFITVVAKYLFTAILIVLLSSCVRTEVEEIHWTTESVPMVFSVITPDHRVELYLGKSNFTKNASTPIPYPEAKVYLCGQDSLWIELKLQSADHSIYVDTDNKMQIEKGKTYSLRIELTGKTLHAHTTVPVDGATIAEASCLISASAEPSNGSQSGSLNVKVNLPKNKEYGLYLSAFSKVIGYTGSLSTGTYQNFDFLYPDDISSFTLNLITMDPYYKKFQLSETVNSGQSFDSDFITIITSTFGGVLPPYSNIENGMGLFGSFITDSRQVMVTTQLK
jgi:hypothetical protein